MSTSPHTTFPMMKILSWNCRGIGNPSKVAALKDLIYCEKPGIFLLQETKQSPQDMIKSLNRKSSTMEASVNPGELPKEFLQSEIKTFGIISKKLLTSIGSKQC